MILLVLGSSIDIPLILERVGISCVHPEVR